MIPQDGHFAVGGTTCLRHRFFTNFDMEFDECGGTFYARKTPDIWVYPEQALERAVKYVQAMQKGGGSR